MLCTRAIAAALIVTGILFAAPPPKAPVNSPLPRTADGKPDLEGIWQASTTAGAALQDHSASLGMPAGRSVLAGGGEIPYQPWAAAKRAANFANRRKEDPLNKCYIPGVPRIMYLDYPFQIFQTPDAIAMTFEWSLDFRLIYTNGAAHNDDIDLWMGDSRGRWEGETLVVDVSHMNDKTWFDMAGDFHSDALHVVERYQMTDPDTIAYEATIQDPKVFTKPWTINLELHRRTDRTRLFEYACEAELEESNGAFTREKRTWYPGDGAPVPTITADVLKRTAAPASLIPNLRRTSDGKPDLQGFYEGNTGGANQGLEKQRGNGLLPTTRGVVVDPADGKLPLLPWALEERVSRNLPERGYDDPTAHCFPGGTPRSLYIPVGMDIIQTKDYIVFLHERMAWRIVPLDGRPHLPDAIRLWQGDSVGRWEGDTLIVDTTNLNGKTWLNEAGDVISYAAHVVERFTPVGPDTVHYEATVIDPVVYSRPWMIAFNLNREKFELGEAACHEEDRDLPHLKAIKDAAAARK